MARYDLSENEWALIVEFFPEDIPRRGRPWSEHRTFMSGVFWLLRSGAAWRDLPERYGPWKTVYNRFRKLTQEGTINKILEKLQLKLDEEGYIDWELGCVDGTNIRASKAAAGASKKTWLPFRSMSWIRPAQLGKQTPHHDRWEWLADQCDFNRRQSA